MGPRRTPENRENAQVIHADILPEFVTGLSVPIARWYIDLSFDQERMPSITGRRKQTVFG